MEDREGRVHRNLVDSSRRLFELDRGARLEADDGLLLGAGTSAHPAISNAAFRRRDEVAPAELLARAGEFFGPAERGYSLWVRDGDLDRELADAAEAAGMREVHRMPEMVLERRPDAEPVPAGAELRRVRSAAEAADFWAVARSSYLDLGFPAEVLANYDDAAGLWADGVVALIAYLGDRAAAIAMTIVSEAVAGIYWVGTLREARGRGLGRAVTLAATEAGVELGAEIASLQASVMGEGVYAAIGFETIGEYRLLMATP